MPSAGAGAAGTMQVPSCPATLHCSDGWSQARSQQTPSTQKVDAHMEPSAQLPPFGIGVGVDVGVDVGVAVGVEVGASYEALKAVQS